MPDSKLIITVTSAKGQPTFTTSAETSPEELRKIVRNRFGLQTAGDAPGVPHSYCGSLVPPAPPSSGPQTISLLSKRGHLRAL